MRTLALLLALIAVAVQGQSVQQVLNARGCSTDAVAGLARQLVLETNALQPGLFSDLRNVRGVSLSRAVQAVPYLQTSALNALSRVVSSTGRTLTINSALRTLPQQFLLYKWHGMGACGIPAAARPGQSNHNGGLAVDVADPWSWVSAMSRQSFRHLGAGDPPHFDYKGAGASDVRSLSIRAFQSLWNKHNPSDRISVDGVYTSALESRLLRAPANGFSGAGSSPSPSPNPPANNNRRRNGPGCSPNGRSGVCVNTDDDRCDDGSLHPGFCPGAANIVCCVSSSSRATAPDNTNLDQTSPATNSQGSVYAAVVIVVGSVVIAALAIVLVLFARRIQAERN